MTIHVWPVDAVSPSLGSVVIAITTGVLTVSTAETLAPGEPVVLGAVTGGAPLVAGTTYYVLTAPTSTTLTLAASVGGALIATTTAGTSTSIARLNGAPSYTGRAIREAQSVYLAGASTADPFGVRSGVRPGTSPTTITATSTTWTVAAHAGALDLETAVEASGYCYAVNATGGLPSGAVTAANATYPRHDVVYAHLDDPAETDGSSVPAVTFGYVAGTVLTAGTLEIVALPARSVAYATVNIPISGGGAPTVTWTAPYAVAAGGILPVPAGVRPANPYVGQYIDDAVDGLLRYNGTGWVGGVGTVLNAQGFAVGTASSGGADLWHPAATVILTPGTWLVQAMMTVTSNTSDQAAASIRNLTASAEVANSRGGAATVLVGPLTTLHSRTVPITVTTSTSYCPNAHPNGGSSLSATITNAAGAPTAWITALRIA